MLVVSSCTSSAAVFVKVVLLHWRKEGRRES